MKYLIFLGVTVLFFSACSNSRYGDYYDSAYSYENNSTYYYDEEDEEPAVGFEGTDTMNACNGNSGNCYDLSVDSNGEEVERLNFDNGGYVDVYSSDCSGGYCVVEDENGTEWELEY